MNAHKIIDYLDILSVQDPSVIKITNFFKHKITESIKFYFDFEYFPVLSVDIFNQILAETKLPYPLCYFEIPRCGVILIKEHNDDIFAFQPFLFFKSHGYVMLDPSLCFAIDKKTGFVCSYSENETCRRDFKEIIHDKKYGAMILSLVSFVIRGITLLSCKNVSIEQHNPPAKLNKARQKRGKQPLFTYHTLVLKPVGKKQESIPKHLWNNRIHLQRGHFKTYTQESPLFGSITGRFWWQPHVRGQNREGVVMKDYKVEAS